MSELTYKKIIDVEHVEVLNDAATVFVNDNGSMKQVPANNLGVAKSDLPHQMLVTNADGETEWQNRTHYSEIAIIDIIPQQDIAMIKHPTKDFYWDSKTLFNGVGFMANKTYTIYFNGVEYNCVPYNIGAFTYLGNSTIWGESNHGNNEPFTIRMTGGQTTGSISVKNAGTYNIRVVGPSEVYHGISGDYTGLYRNDIGALNTDKSVAGNGGKNSFGVIGVAMGEESFAHGTSSMAMSKYSAAFNGTVAASDYQFTCGYNNKADMAGTYLHIVGNGKNGRSNAYTLDWSGNGWFAGTVEGTAMILKSSTEGSTKRFKVTVDDSGTLTVTEIV